MKRDDWRRIAIRIGFAIVLVFSSGMVVADYGLGSSVSDNYKGQSQIPYENRSQVVPERNGITVISGHPTDRLLAFSPDGRLLYYNGSLDRYHDVDPVNGTRATVEYVGLNNIKCDAEVRCGRNVVERVNLSTGDVTRIYNRTVPARSGSTYRWHDIDRIDEHRLLVADIQRDRVFIINTTTEEIGYAWEAIDHYPVSSGGAYPSDWTHVNDVEYLDDGRIMVSLRNQDSVIFLDPSNGTQRNWTLGQDDAHQTIYEQHNPDYIPSENGGPAIVVADSENNRVQEFQRRNGNWRRSWTWSDGKISWPRDADRLPNGHTLIGDTHGGRAIEVNEQGKKVWTVDSVSPYEVERLGTGAESTNGKSAAKLGLDSQTEAAAQQSKEGGVSVVSAITAPSRAIFDLFPARVQHGISFVLPRWMSPASIGYVLVSALTILIWTILEAYWSSYSISVNLTSNT